MAALERLRQHSDQTTKKVERAPLNIATQADAKEGDTLFDVSKKAYKKVFKEAARHEKAAHELSHLIALKDSSFSIKAGDRLEISEDKVQIYRNRILISEIDFGNEAQAEKVAKRQECIQEKTKEEVNALHEEESLKILGRLAKAFHGLQREPGGGLSIAQFGDFEGGLIVTEPVLFGGVRYYEVVLIESLTDRIHHVYIAPTSRNKCSIRGAEGELLEKDFPLDQMNAFLDTKFRKLDTKQARRDSRIDGSEA